MVVNCTGYGSRELLGDQNLIPMKGHLIRVRMYVEQVKYPLGTCNRSLTELKIQNNQRNELFERARPFRLVTPLPAQAQVKLTL